MTATVAASQQGVPDSIQQNLVANYEAVKVAGEQLGETLQSEPPCRQVQSPEQKSFAASMAANAAETIAETTPSYQGNLIVAASGFKTMELAVRAMTRGCAQNQADILIKMNPTLRTVVRVRQGQDLRAISSMIYGTPDNAQALKAANRFSTTLVPPGTLVLCPNITMGISV
jgi:hypothetical protein